MSSSDNLRSRHEINLDEIERHIRGAAAAPPSGGGTSEDPLAELARIVGGGPVPRREAPRQPANPPQEAAPPVSSWTAPRVAPAQSADRMDTPAPRVEQSPQAAKRFETPRERAQFATIEDDIERLLQHNQPRAAARRPDELENAMRSLDNLLRAKQPAPVPPPKADPVDDWSIRSSEVEPAAKPEFEQRTDFEAALAEAAEALNRTPAEATPDRYDHGNPETWSEPPQQELDVAATEEVSRSRRPLMMVAAVLGIAAIGVGGALSMRGEGGRSFGGQPPVIVADKGPTKVVPANPGGLEIPDQNRQILERSPSAPQRPAKVVNSEEQPLDLKEAVRREAAANSAAASDAPGTVASITVSSIAGTVAAPSAYAAAPPTYAKPPMDAGAPPAPPTTPALQPAAADAAPPSAGVAEPRRVRTVAIKPPEPGATRIEPTTPLPQPAPPPVVAAPVAPPPVAPQPVQSQATPAPSAEPTASPAASATPPQPKSKVQGSIGAARDAARQPQPPKAAQRAPETINDAAGGAGPLQITPPARRGADAARPVQRLAAVEPPAPIAAPASAPEAPAAGASGNFVVQLASEGNDESARAAIGRLQSRFSELGSYSSSVQKREVRGQMRYRVRFGSMSREAAGALCASLKSKGQDCILQPN